MGVILLVEDNPDNMKLVSWILEDENWQYAEATTGEQALTLMNEQPFDLVLLDISLPGIDGKETARRIRSNPDLAEIPIVACTAHAIKQEADEIWQAGVNDIVTKPIDERELIDTIAKYLSANGAT